MRVLTPKNIPDVDTKYGRIIITINPILIFLAI